MAHSWPIVSQEVCKCAFKLLRKVSESVVCVGPLYTRFEERFLGEVEAAARKKSGEGKGKADKSLGGGSTTAFVVEELTQKLPSIHTTIY